MAGHRHEYDLTLRWTGNTGSGTSTYRGYARDHEVAIPGVTTLLGSSDPAFRGDPSRVNPEQLLVAAVAQCHLLTYLHLAVQNGLVVTAYDDRPHGVMVTAPDGSGQFQQIVLRPQVTIASSDAADADRAVRLHGDVGDFCFIARSVNFPIRHEPVVTLVSEG